MKLFAYCKQIFFCNILRDCICFFYRACNSDHVKRIFNNNERRILIDQYFVFWWLSLLKCQSAKSRKCFDGDSEVNWRHNMLSNIVYAYIRKDVMFDKLDMTLLLNSNRKSVMLNRFDMTLLLNSDKKGVMLDRLNITLLLNNEFLNNRL